MTNEEKSIMGDLFYYLRDHCDPPTNGSVESRPFWDRAAEDILRMVHDRWHNHPLAVEMGTAVYSYLEKKCLAKGGG